MQIYFDCDGVLADFDKRFVELFGMTSKQYESIHGSSKFWAGIEESGDFFALLEPIPEGITLLQKYSSVKPIILTGCPRGYWAEHQKFRWRDKHLPRIPMITCKSANKYHFCRPGDVLIDDTLRYAKKWESAGGVFIRFSPDSAVEVDRQLQELLK